MSPHLYNTGPYNIILSIIFSYIYNTTRQLSHCKYSLFPVSIYNIQKNLKNGYNLFIPGRIFVKQR